MAKHPNSYPLIFKKRVIEYYNQQNVCIKDVLYSFKIGKATLFRWIKLHKNNQLTEKMKYKKKKIKTNDKIKNYIKKYALKDNVFNCKYIIKSIKQKFKIKISKSSIYLVLYQMDITYKKIREKKIYGDKKKLDKKVIQFKNTVKNINHDDIISIDEVSIDTNITSNKGWSKKGTRICKHIKANRTRYTVICAISNKKIIGHKIIKGSSNAVDFLNFIKEDLVNIQNKTLLMDNARIHHAKIVKEYMENNTNDILYNVPYHPEFNPIEKCFSVFKNNIKKMKNNENINNLKTNISTTINNIKKKFLKNFFHKSLVSFL